MQLMISGEKEAFRYNCHDKEFIYSICEIQKWVIFLEEEVTVKKKKKGKQEMAHYGKTMPYIKQYILMAKVKQYVE